MAQWIYNSPLVEAVRQRDREKLRAAIRSMSADDFQEQAYSGLFKACQEGLASLARILLEAGADPNEHELAWCCRHRPVRFASERFARESYPPELLEVRPADFPLGEAAYRTPELVSLLLKHGAAPNCVDAFAETPLMSAVYGTASRKVALLLNAGADVNAVDFQGIAVLQRAAAWGKCETLELLLAHGARVNHQDVYGDTALTDAARKGNAAQLHTLIKHGAALSPRNKRGYNALEIAVRLGRHHATRVLLKEGASATARDPRGRPPLFHALCRYRQQPRHKERRAQVVRLLLEHGANATEPIRHGVTPLHLAAWHGWADVLKTMLEYRPQVDAKDGKGRTPLDYAVRRGNSKSAHLLRDAISTFEAPSQP